MKQFKTNNMSEKDEITKIKDGIAEKLMASAMFDGLDWAAVEAATEQEGHEAMMAKAVFPSGLSGVLEHFTILVDRRMLAQLETMDTSEMRVRDKITTAVQARLEILAPYKDAVKLAALYWSVPPRNLAASKFVWRTADVIWTWAGDTSKDYNYYTKRGLLSAVLTSTMMAWVGEDGDELDNSFAFLDRRIENVMQFGKILGKIKR